jgi:hypothetical protein
MMEQQQTPDRREGGRMNRVLPRGDRGPGSGDTGRSRGAVSGFGGLVLGASGAATTLRIGCRCATLGAR